MKPLNNTRNIAIFAASILAAACWGAPKPAGAPTDPCNCVVVTATNPLSSKAAVPIAVGTGGQFTLTLESNKTTGYEWQLTTKPNSKVVGFVTSVYNKPSAQIPGRGGTETWTFKANGRGRTTFILSYLRPWEKNTPPAKTQRFSVVVQ